MSTIQNNRDHRKICLIDGKVGFTGGINLADEYIKRRERVWTLKDTRSCWRAMLCEPSDHVSPDVKYREKKINDYDKYLLPPAQEFDPKDGLRPSVRDNPYDNENVGEEVAHILNHAKRICSHYDAIYLILEQ